MFLCCFIFNLEQRDNLQDVFVYFNVEQRNITDMFRGCFRFNLEQRDICRYRLKLLQYQDRLMTYEVILGGIHLAHEEYDSEFFTRFRDVNIVQAAVEYARVNPGLVLYGLLFYVQHTF